MYAVRQWLIQSGCDGWRVNKFSGFTVFKHATERTSMQCGRYTAGVSGARFAVCNFTERERSFHPDREVGVFWSNWTGIERVFWNRAVNARFKPELGGGGL